METLRATFNSRDGLEQAVKALREQGAVDIRIEADTDLLQQNSVAAMSVLSDIFGDVASPLTMEVVVESSRYRQAEDTIVKYGGQR
ncbi:hypothetical protein [Paenibacillus hamazuiensis]|uniref:hypothetical protein n=1 Tax=Paenibacillus hamazuiensis TaxID=2936508 RepID=UPI00200E92BC|nr:hypothetical protein [Paenibacillus hamazuiensis]